MLTGLAVNALSEEAAVVHAFVATERLQLLVDGTRQGLTRLLDPLSAVECAVLQRTSALGMLAVRPPVGTSVRASLDAVILMLRNRDVDVGVVLLAVSIAACVDGKRMRQALPVRQRLDEISRHLD